MMQLAQPQELMVRGRHLVQVAVLAGLLGLSACDADMELSATNHPAGHETSVDHSGPDFLDCLRRRGAAFVSAHRGGPVPGYAENGLATLQYAFSQGVWAMEVDVSQSRDGVLFLHHDRSLNRTTTGRGLVIDSDWSKIRTLQLVDSEGHRTLDHPARLSDVLEWALETDSLLMLDRKDPVSFEGLIEEVRQAGASRNVIFISYNDRDTIEIAALAPDILISTRVDSVDHQSRLERSGVDFTRVIAWTGTRYPNPAAWQALARRGIEAGFGTLGRPGERLDDTYLSDDDPSEYADMVAAGLNQISTDRPYRVSEFLQADDRAREMCWGR